MTIKALGKCSPVAAYLGPDAQKLVRALLQREPTKRLGYGPSGSRDVQNHPFFKGINWKKLMDCELQSPFKPTLQEDDSVENFDKIWTEQASRIAFRQSRTFSVWCSVRIPSEQIAEKQ